MNKKDLVIVVLATFCLTSTLFMILPSRSIERDPWADVSSTNVGEPDGKVNMKDIAYEIAHFNEDVSNMTRDVNVTNWPQDRPLTLRRGIDKIVLVQAMDGGSGNGFALSLDKPTGTGFSTVCLVYDFEPKGQFQNVTEICLNLIWRGDVAGSGSNPHNVSMWFYQGPNTLFNVNYDRISLSQGWGEPFDTMPTGPWFGENTVSEMRTGFNYTVIQPGMNAISLQRSDNYGDHIYIFSLEIFIEYFYLS